MTARPLINNAQARRVFLDRHALSQTTGDRATGKIVCDLVRKLGFVQVDSINTVARAHDLILHSRCQGYRPDGLSRQLERERTLFEHWTHDAAVIPTDYFPHWHLRFDRDHERLRERWRKWGRIGFEARLSEVLQRISDNGPVCSSDMRDRDACSSGGWWDWHPTKAALEFLWRTGALMVTRREGFRKYYDLTERVLPGDQASRHFTAAETIDWACSAALKRLGFATSGEIAAFWDLVTPSEAKEWCSRALAEGRIIEIDIELMDGRLRRSFAFPEVLVGDDPKPPERIRILSPFDPCLRDRKRAERLFGFRYRIEVFVPEPKREYGYYVFPVLEGSRIIGRIDMKLDRTRKVLDVRAFWPEANISMGRRRLERLRSALERVARFAGVQDIDYTPSWRKSARTQR